MSLRLRNRSVASTMSSESLTTILNSFVEIMKGDPAQNSSVSWIRRFDCRNFNNTQEYPGMVERILSENVAVITVASCADKQVWENEQKDLARAVKFGSTSSPPNELYCRENQHGIKALKEGDLVTVRIGLCEREKGNIFYYYVKSLKKVGRKVEEDGMSKIWDPLRGIVEKMVTKDEGVIKFQSYSGNVLRASFRRENFHYKGLRVKECPVSALVRENSLVYLELSEGDMKEGVKETFYGEEIILKASSVWLKDDQRPREESDKVEEVPGECITSNEAGSVDETDFDYSHTGYGTIPDSRNLPGKLVSVEQDWGLVAVGEQVYVFYSNAVRLFGLKVEQLPLDTIFSPDQVVRICLEGEQVTSLTYGCSLTTSSRKEAISHYCVQKSLSNNIKNSLEDLNRQQSHGDS
ncbi:hypothetical protein J437_LFUL014554 [Ladona fulva]|uniref:Uncharacterized protein n=1 Tax=Ladona fulva TaxID=123851 RepID=A0A8K0KH07_LADFU|nr:hypothetical protein J437_LFUL014554 [Ladona fulva]